MPTDGCGGRLWRRPWFAVLARLIYPADRWIGPVVFAVVGGLVVLGMPLVKVTSSIRQRRSE
jgi:hypothetical protein